MKKIGLKAVYEDVSPMTYRHNRCLHDLTVGGYSIKEIPQVMGCTLIFDLAVRTYAKLLEKSGQSGISVCESYWLEPVLNHVSFTVPDRELLKK